MDHWDRLGFGQCAVATRSEPELVIGFGRVATRNHVDAKRLNLGYRLHTAAWGKGYATELGKGILRHALSDLGKPEVFAIVRPINTPSIRVLEKIGMQRIGVLMMFRAKSQVICIGPRQSTQWPLTLPSSGPSPAGFASLHGPLKSNARPQKVHPCQANSR